MINFFVILLLCIMDQVRINLGGLVSVLDIFVLVYAVLYIIQNRGMGIFARDREIRTVSRLFAALVVVQIVSEILVDNSLANAAKGIGITGVCYVKFLFLLGLFFRNKSNLAIFLLGSLIANILFFRTNDFFGLGKMDVESEDIAMGEGLTTAYFKYKISPLINSSLILVSIYYKRIRFAWVLVAVGVLTIVLGARSSGLILLIAGVTPLLVYHKFKWNRKRIAVCLVLVAMTAGYGYKAYVDSVLKGEINSGNSQNQLASADNPYNVFDLLKLGRTEVYVGALAFTESPWIGWGAWPRDPGLKFNALQSYLQGKRMDKRKFFSETIPTHSVIVGYAVYNGIFAVLLIVAIIWFFLRRGATTLRAKNIFVFLLVSTLANMVWDTLFSPVSTVRFQFVLYFATLYYIYKVMQYPELARKYGYVTDDKAKR